MGQIDFYTKDVSGITNRVGASIKSMADFDYTGSQAPTSLAFLTQGTGGVLATEKMRLTNAGFLGIGTSTPGSKLTIVGGDLELDNNKSIKVGSSNSDTTLLVGNYADGQGFAYGTTSPNHAASLAVEGDVKGNRLCIQEDCKAAWSDIVIAGGGNQWSTSGNNIFNANTGGVGIGTSTPGAYKLFVNGNTNINGILTATSFSGTYAGTIGSPNVSSGAFASNTGGGNFSFPGSVGIGTTNPISTLNLHNVGSDTAGSGALSFTVSNDTGPGWNMRVGAAGSDGDFFIDRRLASLWYNVLTMDRTTGNTSINGTLTATSFSGAYNGTIGSPNVSAGAFASNTGGGNFSFPGSLGIGTTAPTAPLHIFGAGKLATFGDTVNNTKYIIIRDSVANGLMFGLLSTAFGGGDGTAVIRAGGNKAFAVKANDTTDFPSISSYDFLINTSGNAIFSGNVGMGTTTLGAYRLNVNGDTNINGALSATSFSGAYAGTINSANVSAGAFASNTGGGNFSFPGNVGIGTTNPLVKLDVSSGTYGLPATSSTIQTAGALRLEAGAFGNVVLDMGVNGASGTWLQTTNKTDLSQEYPLLLNPNGGNVGIGTTNPSRPLTVIGNAQFGDTNSTGTLTPLNVSFGGTYGTNIPGTVGNLKWDMFTNGSSGNRYGIGMSTNLMEFQAGSSGQLGFFVNQGTEAMRILANGSVGIGTSTPGAYKLYVNGDTNINGAVTATSFSGPYVGTINSGNVSAGTFASNTGGGNFSFPGNLGIGTAVPNSQLSVGTVSGSGVKTILEGQVSSYPTYASRIQVSGSYNQAMILDLDYNNLSAYDSFQINMHGNQTQFFISNSGNVGIGTTNPAAKLDIYSGGTGLIIGGDSAATTRTDATLKYGRIGAAHYLNAQAPMGILLTQSDSTRNILNFGGGTGTFNAATEINFYTAANNTTLTGTNRMTINSSGNVGIGTANPSFKLDVSGSIGSSANSITGYIDTGRNVTPWDQTFEENIIGWSQINSTSITQSSAQEYEGSNSLMIKRNDTGGSGGAMFTLGTQLIPGRTYTLSGYYKMVNGAGTASIKLNSNGTTAYTNGTAYTDKTLANAANWTFFSVSITAATITVGNNYVWIGSAMPDAVQELYFDNLVFSEGSLPSNTYANMKTNLSGASTYFGGNVGVGTANPGAYRLNVNGDTNITGTLNVTGTITGGAAMTGTLNAGNVSSGAFASNTGGGNFSFPGNIGIGTTLPTYALDNASTTRSLSYALVGGGGSISATGLFTTAGVTNGSGIIQNTGVIVSPSNDFSDARIWRPVSGNGVFNAFAFTGSIMQTGTANGTTRGLYIAPTLTAALDFRAIEMTNSTGFGLYQSGAANNYFNGSIGIGTSTPTEAKLVINAGVGMALKAYGNVVVTGTLQTQTGSDFAEEFTTTKDLETGTVVVMDDNGYKSVRPCDTSYDKTVVGIVSNNPSIIAGRVNSKYKAVIAMMGVVKVKVIDINGKVSKGDMLTTSGVSGYAMKADSLKPGTMIGKAMENLDGKTGEINVLVNLQ